MTVPTVCILVLKVITEVNWRLTCNLMLDRQGGTKTDENHSTLFPKLCKYCLNTCNHFYCVWGKSFNREVQCRCHRRLFCINTSIVLNTVYTVQCTVYTALCTPNCPQRRSQIFIGYVLVCEGYICKRKRVLLFMEMHFPSDIPLNLCLITKIRWDNICFSWIFIDINF